MSGAHSDLLVVGGGVIGLATAETAARRGLTVLLIERERLGARASWAGAGMITARAGDGGPEARHLARLLAASRRLYEHWAPRLADETGLAIEYRREGGLELFFTDAPPDAEEPASAAPDGATPAGAPVDRRDPAAAARALAAAAARAGIAAEALTDRGALMARAGAPGLAAAAVAAVWFPDDAQVRSPRLLSALARAARRREALLREGAEVRDLWIEGERCRGAVLADQTTVEAAHTVVAAGAWSARLPALVRALPRAQAIVPVRGQMLCYRVTPRPARALLVAGARYLVPRGDGTLLIGSTTEHVGFEDGSTKAGERLLGAFAAKVLPALAGARPVQSWAGLRPGLAGPHPLVGSVPGVAGLWIAAGHYRDGLALAPLTAEGLVAQVLGEPGFEVLRPCAPRAE